MNDWTQKSAGQNTGTNRIAILEEKPKVVKQPWLTAGTLQEDLKLSSEEVRDDEHLRYIIKAFYFLHRTNRIVRELPLIFKGFLQIRGALQRKPNPNQTSNEIMRAFPIQLGLAKCCEYQRMPIS
jgi:hypothetical protein